MSERNQWRKKQKGKGNPEDLLRRYFEKKVAEVRVPSFPGSGFRAPRGEKSQVNLEVETHPPGTKRGEERGDGGGLALNLARTAAALFLCLGGLNLYLGIGPKPLLSEEIARIYHEQDLKEKVESAFFSAHTFLNTYFYNRNTEGEKQ